MRRLLAVMMALGALNASSDWLIRTQFNGHMSVFRGDQKVGEVSSSILRPGWNGQGARVDYSKDTPGKVTGVFGSRNGSESLVDYELTYRQVDDRTIEYEHRFTPREDTEAHAFKVSLDLDSNLYGGGTYVFDNGVKGILPTEFKDIHVARTCAGNLDIDAPAGRLIFRLDGKSTMLIQDNRRWGFNRFELRYSCRPSDAGMTGEGISVYRKGVTYASRFTLVFPEKLTLSQDRPVVMKADETWIPLVNHLEIEKDSVIDFTDVVAQDAPAGKHGWTVANGQSFEFTGRPGVQQRFYGVNFCMGAHNLTHEESDILADRLARFGYNTVRFHHHENNLTGFNRQDSCQLDKERLDRFDYLFAALKKRGIYMTTDVYVSRQVNAHEIYPGQKGVIGMNEFKMLCAVNRRAMESWKRFAKAFLGHVNPYTGLSLANDPALNVICMVNEGVIAPYGGNPCKDLFQADWLKAWNDWLARRFPTAEARAEAGVKTFPATAIDQGSPLYPHFLFDTHQAMYREMTSFLRDELGSKALFTDMNNSGRRLWAQSTRATFDYVDDHFYIDHPRFLGESWRLPSTCDNLSVMKTGRIGGAGSSFIRVLDRPFTITEWNYSGPGRYRGIGGIMTGCLAAIQNWGGLWRFAYSHSNDMFNPTSRAAGYFDVVSDPFAQVTERATLCLFLRRDLAEAKHTIALTLGQDWAKDPKAPEVTVSPNWLGYNLVAKVGTFVGDRDATVPADFSVSMDATAPKAAFDIPWNEANGDSVGALVKSHGWLPKNNLTDFGKRIFQTADGQFMIDGERNAMILNTAMTAGGFVEKGDTVTTDVATFKVLGADATVWVSSVTKEPIRTSSRLLLSHVTELHNSGQKYAEEERKTVMAWGRQPFLVHDGSVEASIALDQPGRYTVYRVDLSGRRLDKVESRIEDGRLAFTLNIRHQGKAQLLYEIVAE